MLITTEKGGLCNDDSDCRNGQTRAVDTTALACNGDQDCPADYGCSVDGFVSSGSAAGRALSASRRSDRSIRSHPKIRRRQYDLASSCCAALAALVACEGNTTITPDAGELSARCVSSNNQAAIDQGLGFACGRGRWCDRVDGICKAGECGYDEDCEEGFACDTENNVCRPPCDLGGGIGCECTVDAECPALSFCWGGNCLNAGTRRCSRTTTGPYSTRIVRRTRAAGAGPSGSVPPVDMGTDCVTDSDCAGSACNGETGRCETLACMPDLRPRQTVLQVSAVIRRQTPASKT